MSRTEQRTDFKEWMGFVGNTGLSLVVKHFHPLNHDTGFDEFDGPGWYHRVAQPNDGHCREWTGPFVTVFHAIRAAMKRYAIDTKGDWIERYRHDADC